MKSRLCLLIGVVGLGAAIFLPRAAMAAACTADAPYGVASSEVSTLPSVGTYTIWTRMQAADSSHSRYQLEINNDTCYNVGGDSVNSSEWTWVNYQNNDSAYPITYDFTKTTGNTIKLYGIDEGVKIDTLLFTRDSCEPTGLGDNCRSATVVQTSGSTLNLATNAGPVSGTIAFSSLVPGSSEKVMKVEYSVDGKKIQIFDGPLALDTTLIANGTHTITVKTTYTDGTVTNDSTDLEIENETTAFSPLLRWMRLNQGPLMLVGILLGIISILGLAYAILRGRHIRRHYRRTHGL